MKPADLPPDFSPGSLLAEANRCVACGLCLPHCPTYRKTLSEADSPRGRIALISGVASGRIPMNARFALHIDRCLTCRACEAVCPNHVAYGQLVDGMRAVMLALPSPLKGEGANRKHWLRGWAEKELIAKPARLDKLRPLMRFYQQSGLQGLLRKSGWLGKTRLAALEAQVPPIVMPCSSSAGRGTAVTSSPPSVGERQGERGTWQSVYPATGKPRGEVGLFLGCIARLADTATLNAAIFVLNRLGYTVHLPPAQTCCGALHQHGGDAQTAALLAQQNLAAFDGLKLQAIISTASGCGAQLAEYPLYRAQEIPARQAADFSAKVMDISAFLATAEGWDDVNIAPLPDNSANRIAVHDPCSLRNVLRGAAHPYALLVRIPGAQMVALAGNDQCCGAAGTYFLDQPEMAKALLDDKMVALNYSGARYLVSSNVGCALHLASGLRQAGLGIEVLHPVTLLARQMGWSSMPS